MKQRHLIALAVGMLAVGVIGLSIVLILSGVTADGVYSSPGQRIYYTGADATGPIPRTIAGGAMGFGMMGNGACVGCHGEDGRGGRLGMMFGAPDIPDIRYSVLTATRTEEGTSTPAWTETDIASAIRDGVEPNGQTLKSPMPHWAMNDADLADVIAYLKELSNR
jgi:mono/diheme cytochrome c family protein